MVDVLGEIYGHSGYRFVRWAKRGLPYPAPYAFSFKGEIFQLPCSAPAISTIGLKTLVDATAHASAQRECRTASRDEDPFFVLLDDDRQVLIWKWRKILSTGARMAGRYGRKLRTVVVTVEIRPTT